MPSRADNRPPRAARSLWGLLACAALLCAAAFVLSLQASAAQTPQSVLDVTIATSPPNLTIVVDGVPSNGPQTFSWVNGSNHTVSVDSPQTAGTTRFVFANWSDGGPLAHVILAENATTLTAQFDTDYLVNVSSSPEGLEATVDWVAYTTPVELWWRAGTTHDVTPAEAQYPWPGVNFRGIIWLDSPLPRRLEVADGPKQLHFYFEETWYLLTFDLPAFASGSSNYPSGWYNANDTARFTISGPPENASQTRDHFAGWRVTPGNGTLVAAANGSVLMDGPKTVTGLWVKEHELLVSSSWGAPTGGGWYAEGESAVVALNSTVETQGATRYLFSGWSGAAASPSADVTLFMDGPKAVAANWRVQYFVEVFAAPANASGRGWYNPGDVATVSIDAFPVNTSDTRWTFAGWSGAVNSTDATVQVPVDNAGELRVVWHKQYLLTIVSDQGTPLGGGWYDDRAVAPIAISDPDPTHEGGRYSWSGWQGGNVTMDGPRTIVVHWEPSSRAAFDPFAAGALIVGLVGGAIVVANTPRGQFFLGGAAIPLFTRLRRDDVRNQFTRGRILQFIEDNPGANYAHVRRRLALSNGSCAYHLRVLERNGDIRRVVSGVSVRFYGAQHEPDEEALPPLSYVQRRILEELVREGSANFGQLSSLLQGRGEAVTDTNLGYHLNVLVREKQLISARREGRKTIYFVEEANREGLRRRLKEEFGVDEAMEVASQPGSTVPSEPPLAFGTPPKGSAPSQETKEEHGRPKP